MSVKVSDVKPTTRQPTHKGWDLGGLAIAFFGLLIGFVLWLFSARYTVDGVLDFVNAMLGFLHIPWRFIIPPTFPIYLILTPIPTLMTYAEWQKQPFARTKGEWRFGPAQHWLVWTIVMGLDAITTFRGIGVDPGPGSLTIMRELADSSFQRGLVAAILTYGPEWIWRWCRRQFRDALGLT